MSNLGIAATNEGTTAEAMPSFLSPPFETDGNRTSDSPSATYSLIQKKFDIF